MQHTGNTCPEHDAEHSPGKTGPRPIDAMEDRLQQIIEDVFVEQVAYIIVGIAVEVSAVCIQLM